MLQPLERQITCIHPVQQQNMTTPNNGDPSVSLFSFMLFSNVANRHCIVLRFKHICEGAHVARCTRDGATRLQLRSCTLKVNLFRLVPAFNLNPARSGFSFCYRYFIVGVLVTLHDPRSVVIVNTWRRNGWYGSDSDIVIELFRPLIVCKTYAETM